MTILHVLTDEKPPSPELHSTLYNGAKACHGETIMFECVALYSLSINWISEEYIGAPLHITSNSPVGIPQQASGNVNTSAKLDRVDSENRTLQSSLHIIIPESVGEQNHTIICVNVDLGTQQSITFQTAGM